MNELRCMQCNDTLDQDPETGDRFCCKCGVLEHAKEEEEEE